MTQTLSPARFRLLLVASPPRVLTAHEGPLGAIAEAGNRESRERDGRTFRDLRTMFGLTLRECAAGWCVEDTELGSLERGDQRFPSAADAWAAYQQLFVWSCERYSYATLGAGFPHT